MSSYLLAQLAAFCETHPMAPKVLLAPTVQVGVNLTSALARQGPAWMNLHVTTPGDWAACHVAPHLEAKGWQRIAQGGDLFLLDALLDGGDAEVPDSFAPPLAPGRARSLATTLHALRRAAVTPAMLEEAALPPAKRRFLASLLQAYEARLDALERYDNVRLFQVGAQQEAGRLPRAVYAVLDATPLSAQAARYVRAIAGDRLWRIGRADALVAPPPGRAAARLAEVPHFVDAGEAHPAGKLWATGLTPEDRGAVALRTAPGAAAEVRGLLRELLDRGIPLDCVEVAYTAAEPYLTHLHVEAERLDLPATFASGRPALLTPTGQALRTFFRWIGQGFGAEVLAALCRSVRLDFTEAPGEGAPSPPDIAAILEWGGYGHGRFRHRTLLQQRIEQLGEEEAAQRTKLEQMQAALDALVELVPEGRPVQAAEVAEAGICFLERFVSPDEAGAAARTSLVERLREVRETVGTEEGPTVRLAQKLEALVEAHAVQASAARPGALHVAPLERAGYTGRPHLYVLGLDAASLPGARAEDPLLPDRERAQLGEAMVLRRAAAGDVRWHLMRALSAARGTVTLCARTHDLAEGTSLHPSALFQQAAEQLGYDDEDVEKPSVPSFSLLPSTGTTALADTALMLAARRAPGFAEAVAEEAPWLAEGHRARTHRAAPDLTRFDGLVGASGVEHDLAEGRTTVSASRLETLAACPHRYFLKHVLEVEPPERPEEDPARWLDPLQFGAFLHELYHAFMRGRNGSRRGAPPELSEADRLMALFEQKIEVYRERVPVQHEAAYRADRDRLERAARVFLAAEARRDEAEPAGFEVSFGRGLRHGRHHPAPVQIELSEEVQLRLRGQIDRIDRLRSGDYAIWDYKSGSMRRYDADDLGAGGQRLQWALYAYAFEEMLRCEGRSGRVVQSGYFFASDRGHGRRIAAAPPPREQLAAQLRPLLELVENSAFPHAVKDRGACTYCDYHRLCADEAVTTRRLARITEAADGDPICQALTRWMQDG